MGLSERDLARVQEMTNHEKRSRIDPTQEPSAVRRRVYLEQRRSHRRRVGLLVLLGLAVATATAKDRLHDAAWEAFGDQPGLVPKPDANTDMKNKRAPATQEWLFFQLLPFRAASWLWWAGSGIYLPVLLRSPVYRLWAWAVGEPIKDLKQPLTAYPTLQHWFVRSLRPGSRPVSAVADLVCPCDGTVTECGDIVQGTYSEAPALNVKGFDCGIETLLGFWPQNRHGSSRLHYCVVQIPFGAYHHFHAPAHMRICGRTHRPGELLPSDTPGHTCVNERVVAWGEWEHGFLAVVPVGSLGRGSVRLDFEPGVETNLIGQNINDTPATQPTPYRNSTAGYERTFEQPVLAPKGSELGHFRFGSTVVMVFEAANQRLNWHVQPGDCVRCGEALASCTAQEANA